MPELLDTQHDFLTYYLTPEGGHILWKVMFVINYLNPDITYCPLMEPIVAIFLHFMDEADCFACISGLLASKTVPFLDQTKCDNISTDATLQDLFKSINVSCADLFISFF